MEGFEALYELYLDAVFRYALRCVGRREIAEEIASEVFLALYREFDKIERARLPAWLFSVAKNRAVDYWRRRAIETNHLRQFDHPSRSPQSELSCDLFDSTALKPVHRVCLILRYVHGLERREIAASSGLSENQVRGHLQYALQLLRKEIGIDPA